MRHASIAIVAVAASIMAACEGGWAPDEAPPLLARLRDDPTPRDATMAEVDRVLSEWVATCGITRAEADLYAEEYGDSWARAGFRHAWQHLFLPHREQLRSCMKQHYVALGTIAQDDEPGYMAEKIQAAARQRYPTGSGLFRYWLLDSYWALLIALAVIGIIFWRLLRFALAPKRALRQSIAGDKP